jgi:two-component system, cell cycle sensor histidine kinase and response regulator CckA
MTADSAEQARQGIALETTARQRVEAAEDTAQRALEHALQAANVGLWDLDLQTNRIHYSHAWKQQLGYADDEIGDSLDEWERRLHPDDRARARNMAFAHIAAAKPNYEQEFRLQHKDGSYRWILARGTVYYDADGTPAHAIGLHIDLTEKKLAEAALRERERQQHELAVVGQLAAGIAHDFNNIMAVVSIYAEMTSEAPGLTEKERARTLTIVEQTQRAAGMIRQILDFSRKAVYERQVLDLLPLLKEQVKLLRQTLPESIAIRFAFAPGEYLVQADSTRMQQMIVNLALNARDAMPAGGVLHVSLDQVTVEEQPSMRGLEVGAWVRVIVRDTGVGIPPEHLEHIFEPFFTTKEPGKGTGLGLAQVQGIVGQHEGQIAVVSEVGAGTTFTIYLPAVLTQVLPTAAGPAEALAETVG